MFYPLDYGIMLWQPLYYHYCYWWLSVSRKDFFKISGNIEELFYRYSLYRVARIERVIQVNTHFTNRICRMLKCTTQSVLFLLPDSVLHVLIRVYIHVKTSISSGTLLVCHVYNQEGFNGTNLYLEEWTHSSPTAMNLYSILTRGTNKTCLHIKHDEKTLIS